jgi:Zn-dependent protease with chaperone function
MPSGRWLERAVLVVQALAARVLVAVVAVEAVVDLVHHVAQVGPAVGEGEAVARVHAERRERAANLRVHRRIERELAALDRAPLHELVLHAEDRRDLIRVRHQRASLVRHPEEARHEVAEERRALREHLAHGLGLHARALARAVRDEARVRLGRDARELREEARIERGERVGAEEVVEAQAVRCERRDHRGAHGARTIRSAPHPAITAREFDHASSRAPRAGISRRAERSVDHARRPHDPPQVRGPDRAPLGVGMASASDHDTYPPTPGGVPADLTAPSPSYRRHAWVAVMGLLAFVGVYLGLTGYLGWVVWRTLGHALWTGQSVGLAVLVSLPACFFLAFLLRGLFVVRHEQPRDLVEVTPDSEPELFAFLHRLADETRAPRPHKVFLSPRVNAAVFYDLSFWNLLLPSRKNLEIGLGLVNALSLDELKAVVAHEYGHFAQRTMAVGRWVYVARQVAGHVVGARGIFDAILQFLSNIDLRVAWIGWILRLFVWAIRAVLDTMLRLVILAQRALAARWSSRPIASRSR